MYNTVNKYKNEEDIIFLFVNTLDNTPPKEAIEKYIKSKDYGFNVFIDSNDYIQSELNTNSLPTKIIIDKLGNLRYKQIGDYAHSEKNLEDVIHMLLK